MIAEELLALAAKGEGETVEFKRFVAELDKVVETVSAFANTRGGVVLIGVRSDGQMEGTDVGQTTRERIANRITGNTDPTLYPSNEGKELTNQQYRTDFRVAVNTALMDLRGLVQTGWVQQIGLGRNSKYRAGST